VNPSAARGPASKHLEVAAVHADLGLPVPEGTRFRVLKRVLGRLMWPFLRHQSLYNHAMLEAVRELEHAVETIRTSTTEHVGNEIGGMRSEVGALEVDVRSATGQLKATAARVEALEARVRELARAVGAEEPSPEPGTRPG
jgi:hypothetical protein